MPHVQRLLGRRRRLLVAALTLLCLPVSAWAAAAAPPDTPPAAVETRLPEGRFLIERIVVEGDGGLSPEIVGAASLLEEGESYSEAELADAASRIVRLPLVLGADFSLRKGSRRGRFELVIRVEEARRWFFGLDSELTRWASEVSVSGLTTTDWVEGGAALAGRRFAVGRRGVSFVVLSGVDGLFSVGHSQHDLFGSGALLTVSLSVSDCAGKGRRGDDESLGDEGCQSEIFDLGLDPTFSTWNATGQGARARFNLGVPIAGNHSLRFQATARSSDSALRRSAYSPSPTRFFELEELRDQELSAAWVYDSTDDPLFPTRGLTLEAGLDLFHLEAEVSEVDLGAPAAAVDVPMESVLYGVTLAARRHWPVAGGQALSAGGRLFLGRSEIDNVPSGDGVLLTGDADAWRAEVTLGHSAPLQLHRGPRRWRELRWVNDLDLFHRGTSPGFGQPENPLSGYRLSTGLVFRTTWGVFSFRLSYFDGEGR